MITNRLDKEWSNYIKLIAAILVAVSHYSTVIVINNHWSDSNFLRLWCQGGYIGVAIFFFFSGFGLMESENKKHLGAWQFFRRRLSKVYLPVLAISIVWIPVFYFLLCKESNPTLSLILYDLVWGFRDPVLWFVKILILQYAIFYVFVILRKRKHDIFANVFFLSSVALVTLLASYCKYPFISVPLFGVGVYSSMLKDKDIFKVPFPILMVGALMLICAFINIFHTMLTLLMVCSTLLSSLVCFL